MAGGPSEVGIKASYSAIGKGGFTVQKAVPLFIVFSADIRIYIVAFIGEKVYLYPAQSVNYLLERFKVHQNIGVHRNAEVFFQSFVQKLHSAEGIGGVQLIILVLRNLNITVAQEGNQRDLFCIKVHIADNHGVGTGGVIFVKVGADKQNIK